jgi:protein-S-isoprenylcysteine O-methyltransferase Ste14
MKEQKSDTEIFVEHVPAYTIWYKTLFLFSYHFIIFLCFMIFLLWASSTFWMAILPLQLMTTSISNVPFMYMFKHSDSIRKKYTTSKKRFPWQSFWLHYSYTSPFGCAALYFPLLLKTDYFLPKVISLPSNFFTNTLLPQYIALPVSIIIVIIGILLVGPSKDYDGDMGNYLHIMSPEKKRALQDGIYQYIRHPRYLSRLILAIGFGFFANNLLAIGAALTHFIPYYVFMKISDKELIRMFGDDIKQYQRDVPALLPKYENWKLFSKLLFSIKKKQTKLEN